MPCPALQLETGFVTGSFAFIDCHARTLGAFGYQALAAPGSIAALMLTGLLTLFVAGFGFRMLMGETPDVRNGVTAIAKVAFVLALATAWAPYRTLVYDVTLGGPTELVAAVGAPADLPGTTGGLGERLDLVDQALIQLNDLGIGRQRNGQQDMRNRQVVGSQQVIVEPAQGNPNPIEPYAFALARVAFLLGAVGAFGAVRLVAGLLLALGPLFVAFALFDTTRGLFEGWVRGLAGVFLGTIAVAILLAVELAFIETWIADLLAQRLANSAIPGAAIELVVVTLVFDMILIAGLAASTRLPAGFRLPARAPVARTAEPAPDGSVAGVVRHVPPAGEPRSRALALADSVAALQRREMRADAVRGGSDIRSPIGSGRRTAPSIAAGTSRGSGDVTPGSAAPLPLGRTFQRRPQSRTSASAGRRDGRS